MTKWIWIRNIFGIIFMVCMLICTFIFEQRPEYPTDLYSVEIFFYGPKRYVAPEELIWFRLLIISALIYFPVAFLISPATGEKD